MSYAKPIILRVDPFDARYDKKIEFASIGGDRYTSVELKLSTDNDSDISIVYNTFSNNVTIPGGRISNSSGRVRIAVRVGDGDAWSEYSQEVLVNLATTPSVGIIGIEEGLIRNNTYTFKGSYSQPEGVGIRSFSYTLYDSNMDIVKSTKEFFNPSLSHTISGLKNDTEYYIRLSVTSDKGVVGYSEKYPIYVKYFTPSVNSFLHLEPDIKTGDVVISTKLKQIIAKNIGDDGIESSPAYESFVNLDTGEENIGILAGDKIIIEDGLSDIGQAFSIKIFVKLNDVSSSKNFFTLVCKNGDMSLFWESKKSRFRIDKTTPDGITTFYVTDSFADVKDGDIFTIVSDFNNSNISLWTQKEGSTV